jgi:hypothetical protein
LLLFDLFLPIQLKYRLASLPAFWLASGILLRNTSDCTPGGFDIKTYFLRVSCAVKEINDIANNKKISKRPKAFKRSLEATEFAVIDGSWQYKYIAEKQKTKKKCFITLLIKTNEAVRWWLPETSTR